MKTSAFQNKKPRFLLNTSHMIIYRRLLNWPRFIGQKRGDDVEDYGQIVSPPRTERLNSARYSVVCRELINRPSEQRRKRRTPPILIMNYCPDASRLQEGNWPLDKIFHTDEPLPFVTCLENDRLFLFLDLAPMLSRSESFCPGWTTFRL